MKYKKGSFLVIPNKGMIIGCEPHVQAVFIWICNYADEEGTCFPSRQTLAINSGCSVKSVDRALEVLIEIGVISKESRVSGNKNLTNFYQILIGGSVPQSLPSVPQSLGVASEGRTELNPVITESPEHLAYASEIVISPEYEKPVKEKKDTTYRRVFDLWGKYPLSWRTHKTQIQAAKNLVEEHGFEEVADAVKFATKHKSDQYCPEIHSPWDLDTKWSKLEAFYDKRV